MTHLAELQEMRLAAHRLEHQISEYFTTLATQQGGRFDRCSDYGQRGVSLYIPYDNINVSALDSVVTNTVRGVVAEYHALREKQRLLELQIDQEYAIQQNIRSGIGKCSL